MSYPDITQIDMTNPINIIYYVNDASHQIFGMGIIFTFWILVLIGYYKAKDDFTGAFAVSCFVAWVLSLLGWIGELISPYFFAIVTGLTIISALILFSDRGNS